MLIKLIDNRKNQSICAIYKSIFIFIDIRKIEIVAEISYDNDFGRERRIHKIDIHR